MVGFGFLALTAMGLVLYAVPQQEPVAVTAEGISPDVHAVYDVDGPYIAVRSAGGGDLYVSHAAEGALLPVGSGALDARSIFDRRRTERLVSIPTAMQWRRPLFGQPSAMVLRVAEMDAQGRLGPERIATLTKEEHGALPVLSLVLPEGALFDPDSGIYVVGNAMLHGVEAEGITYASDPRWWKYPGNFHGRGKEWERRGRLQLLDTSGVQQLQAQVRVRINGQMTRAFPQHALRILFDGPLDIPLFANGDGVGMKAMIVRSAGNDQIKAFMRDALLHKVGAGGRSETSDALTCVLYINGVYWGVHHIRHRMDEKELARRHGLKPKSVTIAEVVKGSFSEQNEHNKDLRRLVNNAGKKEGKDFRFLDSLHVVLDVDAFLEYMATMFYMDNRDWPGDNVRLWRSTDRKGGADGRWRPIIQDLDLAFGAHMSPTADPMPDFKRTSSPIVTLFLGMMRDPGIQEQFDGILSDLLATRFDTERVVAHVDSMEALLAPEMERHTARWRKPVNAAAWRAEVQVLRAFAQQRPAAMRKHFLDGPLP